MLTQPTQPPVSPASPVPPVPLPGPLRVAATDRIDPRGARFAAGVTSLVLAAALLATPSVLATVLVAVQTAVFAVGALAGPRHSPYARAFALLLRPRLGPPAALEDAAPPRFAQSVGLGFGLLALAGYLSGATLLGAVAAGLALGAAFLNAAFDLCLGCEAYLLLRRLTSSRAASSEAKSAHPAVPQRAGAAPVATKG